MKACFEHAGGEEGFEYVGFQSKIKGEDAQVHEPFPVDGPCMCKDRCDASQFCQFWTWSQGTTMCSLLKNFVKKKASKRMRSGFKAGAPVLQVQGEMIFDRDHCYGNKLG